MISLIAACDQNRLIGVDNTIPWTLPEDLRRFKRTTMGGIVIMGRATFRSLDNRPLPGRLNVVIGSFPEGVHYHDGYYTCHDLRTAIEHFSRISKPQDIFLIGGQRIFEEGLQYADTIFLTRVHAAFYGKNDHRYFPQIDPKNWAKVGSIEHGAEGLTFETYCRVLP